ncbi:Phosphatidyl_synthase [Hexamita inflata]|uniref:Phosphatidyl synthase n=1 Tax=Hexamita inflata TaxID=28002 RepID=A0AA86USP0_9EUKA|nr:Phosphatidyl synthase [Hexamita inflata]
MNPVFLLDVDGVLKRGYDALECGQRALDYLNDNKIPYLLVSNTTGDDEQISAHLSHILGRQISPQNFICASTPLTDLMSKIPKQTPILALGAPKFTRSYFNKFNLESVFYSNELFRQFPESCPQYKFTQTEPSESKTAFYQNQEIEYLIFHSDSTDWYADNQIALDCIMNHGQMNPQIKGNPEHKVKIICTNPDLTYADKHILPRLTVGMQTEQVKAMYKLLTGNEFEIEYHGKPYNKIFETAKSRFADKTHTFYMIGDSLQSDIRGGNQNNCESVLVLTGKAQIGDWEQLDKEFTPKHVYGDVLEAIKDLTK